MGTPEAEEASSPVLSDLLLRSLKRTYDMYTAEAVTSAPPTFLPRYVRCTGIGIGLNCSQRACSCSVP